MTSKLIAFRPAPAQTRPPRSRASRAPRPLARGRCPPHLRAHRRADASAAWAPAMPPGAVEGAMGQTPSYRPCRSATRPGPGAAHRAFDGRLRSSGAPGRSIIGQRGCARLSAEAQRRPCALARHAHRPLAHRASGLGPGGARRLPEGPRAAPLRAPSCRLARAVTPYLDDGRGRLPGPRWRSSRTPTAPTDLL